MTPSRSLIVASSGAALAAAAVGAIALNIWRDLPKTVEHSPAGGAGLSNREFAGRPPSAPAAPSIPKAAARAPAAPSGASPAPAKQAALSAPAFDIVRVEPSGDSVVAGRALPHARVELLDNGKAIASVIANSDGQFVILPPALAPGPHQLALSAASKDGTIQSRQSVTVALPKQPGGRLIVALAQPGVPTKILADKTVGPAKPGAAPSSAKLASNSSAKPSANSSAKPSARAGQVYFRTVEAGQDGGFLASGTAAPGAKLRLYVNNSPIAAVTAGKDGTWSLRIGKGLLPGSYSVRADAVDPASGRVLSRAEVPFNFKGFASASSGAGGAPGSASAGRIATPGARLADGAQPAEASRAGARAAGDSSRVFLAELPTVRVVRGDNLWLISRRIFGRGVRYTLIFEANANQIRNRNLIYPGQIFVIPKG